MFKWQRRRARTVAAEEDSSDEEDAPRARREPAEYVGPSAGCTAVRARPAQPLGPACAPGSPCLTRSGGRGPAASAATAAPGTAQAGG